jgi:hypothetical protein
VEHDIATIEREDLISPAALGLSIAERQSIQEGGWETRGPPAVRRGGGVKYFV